LIEQLPPYRVGIATALGWTTEVRFPAGARNFNVILYHLKLMVTHITKIIRSSYNIRKENALEGAAESLTITCTPEDGQLGRNM
jgi:hypothetical protein